MRWFPNLGVRGKLFAGFGLMIALLAAVTAMGHLGITAIQTSQKSLYENEFADATELLFLRSSLNRMRASMLHMLLTSERSEQESWERDILNRAEEVDKTLQRLIERNIGDAMFSEKLREYRSVAEVHREARRKALSLIYQGKGDEAEALVAGPQRERYERLRAIADELGEAAKAKAGEAVLQSERMLDRTLLGSLAGGALSLLAGLALAVSLSRGIADPLREITALGERIAAQDLTVIPPPSERTDEVGALGRIFTKMVESLRATQCEIREGAGALAAAVSEILATTTQLAAGATETASAVSETSTTVEEVKQTAQLASEKARQVSDTAQKAAQIAEAGRKSADDTLAAMRGIHDQMESIAESIVRLSEQTQAIGEILATVNDLAEQSNMLAVNASIEAAKAGEQGKGFAVVAQEVKSLAEQSKQATAQVRGILNDIQKATGGVVMATEQGSRAVDMGVRLTAEASESIRSLAEIIALAAQAAMQIAASSQQQRVGMDQVALAVGNIREASLQNMAGARQSEAAAHGLNELGQKLRHLVERYKV